MERMKVDALELEDRQARPPGRIGIAEEVAFLRRPESWPGRPGRVAVVETHLSFVFLADDEVYKLKKPVRFDVQDLRSVEARRQSCETEVLLNRRLAPAVYLGTVPLAVASDGTLTVGGDGAPIDWMVRMKRLPADRFLDRSIRAGTVDPDRLRSAARLLVDFHRRLPPAIHDPRDHVEGLVQQIDAAALRLSALGEAPQREEAALVHRALLAWIASHGAVLGERVAAGRVVEGHGDLRPEHVSLLDEPVVIDCLEFDVRLRTLDTADELGYLALECERLGAPEVGAVFLDTWRAEARDPVPASVVAFHQAMRAFTRGSIPALRLARGSASGKRDPASEHLRERVRSYLASARARLPALDHEDSTRA